jgi:hypothetical protein
VYRSNMSNEEDSTREGRVPVTGAPFYAMSYAAAALAIASYLVPQFGHWAMCLTPLIGITGMMKKMVMNRIPFLALNGPW